MTENNVVIGYLSRYKERKEKKKFQYHFAVTSERERIGIFSLWGEKGLRWRGRDIQENVKFYFFSEEKDIFSKSLDRPDRKTPERVPRSKEEKFCAGLKSQKRRGEKGKAGNDFFSDRGRGVWPNTTKRRSPLSLAGQGGGGRDFWGGAQRRGQTTFFAVRTPPTEGARRRKNIVCIQQTLP